MFAVLIESQLAALWCVVALLMIVFVAALCESLPAAFWATVIGLLALQLATTFQALSWTAENPAATCAALAAYLPIGVAWSWWKWRRLVDDHAAPLRAELATWKPSTYYATWEKYVTSKLPSPSRHKERISLWIAYWPFSVTAYIVGEWIVDCVEAVYKRIKRIYESVNKRAVRNLTEANPKESDRVMP